MFLRLFLIVTFLNVFQKINAQKLELPDLFTLQNKSIEFASSFLMKKGWDFEGAQTNAENSYLDFSSTTWAFKKDKYNQKAQAWLHFYHHTARSNVINYQVADKSHYLHLKWKLKNTPGFYLKSSEVEDNQIKDVYRNNKFEVTFSITKKDNDPDDYYDDDEIYYSIDIINFLEIEKIIKKLAQDVIEKEKLAQKQAEEEAAKQAKIEQEAQEELARIEQEAKIKAENERLKQIEDEKIARKKREKEEKEKLSKFLIERKFTIYDLSKLDYTAYTEVNDQVFNFIKNFCHNKQGKFEFYGSMILQQDTAGKLSYSHDFFKTDKELLSSFNSYLSKIEYPIQYNNGYIISSKAIIPLTYLCITGNTKFKVKKSGIKYKGQKLDDKVKSAIFTQYSYEPEGKYEVSYQISSNGGELINDLQTLRYKPKRNLVLKSTTMLGVLGVGYYIYFYVLELQ